jgi:hypothetical protein
MSKKKKEIKKVENEKKEVSRKFREYSFPSLPPGSPFARRNCSAIVAAWQKYACWRMGLKNEWLY